MAIAIEGATLSMPMDGGVLMRPIRRWRSERSAGVTLCVCPGVSTLVVPHSNHSRPPFSSLLTDDEAKDVAKNLKKFIARYQEEDRRVDERRRLLERLRKRKQRDEFRAHVSQRLEAWRANKAARIALGAEEVEGSEAVTIVEQTLESELGESIEVVA